MTGITYSHRKRITRAQLAELFAGLPVAKRPPQTPKSIASADRVISAWRGGKLVGLACASAQGVTASLSWIHVRKSHRRKGIGRELVERLLARFPDCTRVKLIAGRGVVGFYRKCGFRVRREAVPMIRELG